MYIAAGLDIKSRPTAILCRFYGDFVEEKKEEKFFSLRRRPCLVIFRTEDGSRKKFWMNRDDFNGYQLKKTYHKKQGDFIPDPQSGI
ncbi:MAG: hypothetical protein P8Y80_16895 [Acidobacteriota bacterium]|jgi:hypothetical protein